MIVSLNVTGPQGSCAFTFSLLMADLLCILLVLGFGPSVLKCRGYVHNPEIVLTVYKIRINLKHFRSRFKGL